MLRNGGDGMTDKYECSCCNGTGRRELTGIYADTLNGVRRLCKSKDSFVTAGRYAKWFRCKATALNNRLAMLESHGFLFSEKYGKERRFFLSRVRGG